MAEGTYEYEVMRAELLGVEPPNREEFEKARAERLKHEQDELEAAEAAQLEAQEEALKNAGGKLDELNTILSSTQQKLNRFKQSACGSISNMFGRASVDIPDGSGSPSTSATASRRNTTASAMGGSGAESMEDADELRGQRTDTDAKISQTKVDLAEKMTSHLDKLDSLIRKAEHADISMATQTSQMRKMAK